MEGKVGWPFVTELSQNENVYMYSKGRNRKG